MLREPGLQREAHRSRVEPHEQGPDGEERHREGFLGKELGDGCGIVQGGSSSSEAAGRLGKRGPAR